MLRAARPATTTPGRSRDRRFRSDWVDGVFPASCAPLPPDLTDEEWALLQRAPGPFVARGSNPEPADQENVRSVYGPVYSDPSDFHPRPSHGEAGHPRGCRHGCHGTACHGSNLESSPTSMRHERVLGNP